jgi:hypothetical protein
MQDDLISSEVALELDRSPSGTPGWPLWLFRGCVSVAALLVFNQAVYAGQFLGGSYGSLLTHRENATFAGIAVLACTVPAALVWLLGRGPWWPALICVAMFGLIAAQIAIGFAQLVTVHIPLGVGIIVGTVLLAVWAWRVNLSPAPARLLDLEGDQ